MEREEWDQERTSSSQAAHGNTGLKAISSDTHKKTFVREHQSKHDSKHDLLVFHSLQTVHLDSNAQKNILHLKVFGFVTGKQYKKNDTD